MNVGQTGIFFVGSQGLSLQGGFPRELRRGLFSRIDPRFAGLVAGLVVVSFSAVWMLAHRPVTQDVSDREIQKIQERYARLVLNQPKPKAEPVEKKADRATGQAVKEEKTEEKTEVKVDREKESFAEKQQRREVSKEQRQAKRAEISKQIQSAGIFAAITSTGGGAGSGSADVSDLLGATDAVSGIGDIAVTKGTFATRSVDPATLQARKGERTEGGVDIQKERISRAQTTQIASAAEVTISTEPAQIKGDDVSGGTNKMCIQRVITRESGRIKRVYENWLKKDPALSGSMRVSFVILPSGGVSNVVIVNSTTSNASFDQNILRYIMRWDFASCSIASPFEVELPFAFQGQS